MSGGSKSRSAKGCISLPSTNDADAEGNPDQIIATGTVCATSRVAETHGLAMGAPNRRARRTARVRRLSLVPGTLSHLVGRLDAVERDQFYVRITAKTPAGRDARTLLLDRLLDVVFDDGAVRLIP
jgi:hypothetical protein